jgi:hypothetical protein
VLLSLPHHDWIIIHPPPPRFIRCHVVYLANGPNWTRCNRTTRRGLIIYLLISTIAIVFQLY